MKYQINFLVLMFVVCNFFICSQEKMLKKLEGTWQIEKIIFCYTQGSSLIEEDTTKEEVGIVLKNKENNLKRCIGSIVEIKNNYLINKSQCYYLTYENSIDCKIKISGIEILNIEEIIVGRCFERRIDEMSDKKIKKIESLLMKGRNIYYRCEYINCKEFYEGDKLYMVYLKKRLMIIDGLTLILLKKIP